MKLARLSLAVAATLAAPSAFAALIVSSAVPSGPVQFSDNSAEVLIDRVGAVAGTLDIGDSLRGIFSIDNITGSGPQVAIGAGTVYNELTGLFQVIVTDKVATSDPGRFNYTFGFDAAFGQGAGVVGVLFDDPAQNFARTNCATIALCESTATGGSIWATLGLTDGFWTASNAAENTLLGALFPLTTPLGNFSMGLNFLTNNTGFSWNKVDCVDTVNLTLSQVDICGQGGVLASGRLSSSATNTPYDIFNNVDFTANRVPEPATMALVALGLLGVGSSVRRKKSS